MVASQKRRVESPSVVMPLVIGAVIVCLFVGGLKWGGHSQSVRTHETANELHHREDALRSQMDECQNRQQSMIDKATAMDTFADDLKARNRKLELRNKDLYSEHSVQEEETAKCQEDLDTVTALVTEEDRKQKVQIKALQDELDTLNMALNDITHGQGMRSVLLTQSLKRARTNYLRALNAYNNLHAKQETVKSADEIMSQWKDKVAENDQNTLTNMANVETEVDKWVHWRYDRQKHPEVFLDDTDEDDDPVQPEYFGRRGSQAVLVRRTIRPPQLRRSTLSHQLVDIQDFALCAVRNNNPNFTFPNKFYWLEEDEEDLTEMQRVVSTPLVRFCEGCQNRRWAFEFRSACQGDTVASNYGNYSYWTMRSRIRFQPSVQSKVRDYLIANSLTQKKVLAVVVPGSELTLRECHRAIARGPRRHFMYIRGNFDEQQAASVTNDTESRCAPTWPVIVQRILQELNEAEAAPFDAVYLSVEPNTVDTIHLEDISNRIPVVMREQKSAFDEAVDIEIMAQSSRIIVSPFLKHSQIVTEEFLLRHKLYPQQNVRFW